MSMLLAFLLLVFQARTATGVLDKPDPKQMETAPALGYHPIETGLSLPEGIKMGASSGVAFDAQGHMWVLNRGEHPLMEFDGNGKMLRAMGEGMFNRGHGLRIAPDGNIWTTDVQGHTVMKWSTKGEVVLTLGTRGQSGNWDEAAGTRLLFEPADLAEIRFPESGADVSFRLLQDAVVPRPVYLIGTKSRSGVNNVAPYS